MFLYRYLLFVWLIVCFCFDNCLLDVCDFGLWFVYLLIVCVVGIGCRFWLLCWFMLVVFAAVVYLWFCFALLVCWVCFCLVVLCLLRDVWRFLVLLIDTYLVGLVFVGFWLVFNFVNSWYAVWFCIDACDVWVIVNCLFVIPVCLLWVIVLLEFVYMCFRCFIVILLTAFVYCVSCLFVALPCGFAVLLYALDY